MATAGSGLAGRRATRRLAAAAPARLAAAVPVGLAAAGAAALVALWSAHTPATLHGAGDLLTATGRLTGLAAGYSAAVLVLLMARLPGLESRVGSDRLARWHARLGRYTVSLVVVHGCAVVTGYALSGHVSIGRQLGLMLAGYPWLVPAVAGGLGLCALGALSAGRAMRRLGYQRWHVTHLAAYVAVALAFGHQVTDGADFVYDRPARLAWTAAWAAVAAAVVVFRVVRPLRQAVRHRFRVEAVRPEAAGVVSLYLTGRHLDEFRAVPGQFVRLRALTRSGWWQSHALSLSAPAGSGSVRVTVKSVGPGTAGLQRLAPGIRVLVTGPFGRFTAARATRNKVLLVAAGIGIAPLRALFETIPADQLTLVYRHRRSSPVFAGELAQIAERRAARLIPATERGAVDPGQLSRLLPDLAEHDAFVCGPPGFMDQVAAALRSAGVPAARIHRESFELMDRTRRHRLAPLTTLAAGAACLALLLGPRTVSQAPGARGVVALGPPATSLASARGAGTGRPAAGRSEVLGPAERTLFATVQVEAVFTAGRLTGVVAVSLPNLDARSRQLSAMAAPILRREALAAGGADIRVVSGATYTSGAYAASLQGALDAARAGTR